MRNMARWIAGVVLVLAVAWIGTWWYVQHRLREMLETYAAAHTTADGSSAVSYDNITTGYNPFAASATVHDLRWNLQIPGSGAPVIISEEQVSLSLSVFNPRVLDIGLPNRLDITFPEGTLNFTFGHIAASAGLDPVALFSRGAYPLTGQTVNIQNVAVSADSTVQVLTIGKLSMRETWRDAAGANQTALTLTDNLEDLAIPSWVTAKWNVPFNGHISRVGLDIILTGPARWASLVQQLNAAPQQNLDNRRKLLAEALHGWAQKGGKGKASLSLVIGPTTLKAAANVAFNSDAQPNGTAEITANHLDGFVAALTSAYPQLQQRIGAVEGKYSSYLTTSPTEGQVLNVHIAYGKEGVLVDGTKVADMPPLDWTALENAPSLVPQAPGDGSGAAGTAP